MAATILAWLVYGAFVALRPTGRSAAHLALVGFAVVIVVRHRARGDALLKLSLVGISHHVAPVELRERVALPFDRAVELARALGDAVCLSTCNRTELYLAGERDERALATLEEIAGEPLGACRLPACTTRPRPCTSSASRPGSTRWCPGESEILGQVRAAYEGATVGPAARSGLPPGAAARQARPLGDRDRREPRVGPVRRRRARGAGLRRPRAAGACC